MDLAHQTLPYKRHAGCILHLLPRGGLQGDPHAEHPFDATRRPALRAEVVDDVSGLVTWEGLQQSPIVCGVLPARVPIRQKIVPPSLPLNGRKVLVQLLPEPAAYNRFPKRLAQGSRHPTPCDASNRRDFARQQKFKRVGQHILRKGLRPHRCGIRPSFLGSLRLQIGDEAAINPKFGSR